MDVPDGRTDLDVGWRDEPLVPTRVFGMIRRQAWLVIVCFVLSIVGGLAYIVLSEPVFTASATIQADADLEGSSDALRIMQLDNHVELIQSDTVTSAVIRDLKLDELFDTSPGLLQRSISWVRHWLNLEYYDPDGDGYDEGAEIIRLIASSLDVERVGNTAMIRISYQSPSRTLAMEIANAYASNYVNQVAASASEAAQNRMHGLQDRMEEMRRRASSANETVQRLRFQNGIVVADPADLGRQIADLKQRLAASDLDSAAVRAKLGVISGLKDMVALPSGALQNDKIAQLHSNLIAMSGQLDEIREQPGVSSATVSELERVVADLRQSLEQELRQAADALELELSTITTTSSSIMAKLNQLVEYGQSMAWSQLLEAEREAAAYDSMYDDYRKDLESLYLRPGGRPEIALISEALPPIEPSFPRYKVVLAIAGAIGVVIGGGLAMYREWTPGGPRLVA